MRELATVLVRCLGILLLVNGVLGLPFSIGRAADALAAPDETGIALALGASFLLRVAIGIWFIRGGEKLASKIVPGSGGSSWSPDATDLQAALFGVLGLYFAASAIPELVGQIYTIHFLADLDSRAAANGAGAPAPVGEVVPGIARLVVGIALFLGARPLSRLRKLAKEPVSQDDTGAR